MLFHTPSLSHIRTQANREKSVDGKELGPYPAYDYDKPVSDYYFGVSRTQWSPRGNRLVFVLTDERGVTVTIDGREEGPYESVEEILFSPDGKKLGYIARDAGKRYAIVDGKKMSKGYDNMWSLTFSATGEVAYVAYAANNKKLVGWGEKESAAYSGDIRSLQFMQDASDLIFVVIDDSGVLRVKAFNSGAERTYQKYGQTIDDIGDIVFSPDKKRMAYTAVLEWDYDRTRGKFAMVIDDEKGKTYDDVSAPIFSSDGQHVAYQARLDNKFFVVLDGRELEYDAFPSDFLLHSSPHNFSLPALRFTPDNRYLVHGAKKGADLLWVVTPTIK